MADHSEMATELMKAADSDPDDIDIETVDELLSSDMGRARDAALKALTVLAHDDPDRVEPYVDDIIAGLDDSFLNARNSAAMALTVLAQEQSDDVVPAIPSLVDALDEDPPLFRFRAAGAVAPLADAHPEEFVDHADRLIDALVDGPRVKDPEDVVEDDTPAKQLEKQMTQLRARTDEHRKDKQRSQGTREVAANVLVDITREDPDALADRLSELVPLLSDDVPSVRGAIVEVIRHVAEDDPDAVDEVVDPLLELLDDEVDFVRARAVRALGYAEADEAIEPLRDLAEDEADEDVAELAEDTADWLAERD